MGVLVIFWLLRAEFDNVRDGIVYGALVGVGFNWFEAALYVAQGYAESGVAPYGAQLGSRYALFGLGGHAMTTGIFGAFLGITMQTHRRGFASSRRSSASFWRLPHTWSITRFPCSRCSQQAPRVRRRRA